MNYRTKRRSGSRVLAFLVLLACFVFVARTWSNWRVDHLLQDAAYQAGAGQDYSLASRSADGLEQPTQPTQPTREPEKESFFNPLKILEFALPGFQAPHAYNEYEELPVDVKLAQQIQLPSTNPPIQVSAMGPSVLIYHTHTFESYSKTSTQSYKEVAKWRTTNLDYNVVRVGEELQKQLASRYGIIVLQDRTDHETPKLGTSYVRSLATAQSYIKKHDSLDIIIDLHRDAYSPRSWSPAKITIGGQDVARVMLVIGNGEGQTGNGFSNKPDWEKNIQVAKSITDELNAIHPELARPVLVKTGRYNQHLAPGCILIEVGHNENSLDEALAAMPYLAEAIYKTINKTSIQQIVG